MPLPVRRIAPGPVPLDLPSAAQWYAARGWFVCSLRPGEKTPRERGYLDMRLSPGGARSHWRHFPDDGIGLLLGPSRVLAADLDGPAAVEEALTLGLPADAPLSVSGRADLGMHALFARPADMPPARHIGRGTSGRIDLLGAGFLVLPPSRHPSGAEYAWVAEPTGPLPLPPPWVSDIAAGGSGVRRAERAAPGTSPHGTRSERLRRHLVNAILRDEPDDAILASILADRDLATLQNKHGDGQYLQRALLSAHRWVDEHFT